MICRTGVQDRLKIRLDALVELPFKNSGLLLRLGAFPTCKCLRNWLMRHNLRFLRVQQMPLASSVQPRNLISNYGAEYPMPNLLNHLAALGCLKIGSQWDRCGVYYVTRAYWSQSSPSPLRCARMHAVIVCRFTRPARRGRGSRI